MRLLTIVSVATVIAISTLPPMAQGQDVPVDEAAAVSAVDVATTTEAHITTQADEIAPVTPPTTSPAIAHAPASLSLSGWPKQIREQVENHSSLAGHSVDDTRLKAFYAARKYQPAWILSTGTEGEIHYHPRTLEAIELLYGAEKEGLEVKDYLPSSMAAVMGKKDPRSALQTEIFLSDALMKLFHDVRHGRIDPKLVDKHFTLKLPQSNTAVQLEKALKTNDLQSFVRTIEPPHQEYKALREALASLEAIRAQGGWGIIPPAEGRIQYGLQDKRIPAIRKRMRIQGFMTGEDPAGDGRYYSPMLEEAVKNFQYFHNLARDGVIGPRTLQAMNIPVEARINQLKLNMERWRWMPDDLGKKYIQVNAAGFYLKAVDHGKDDTFIKVIVGVPEHQTPMLASTMQRVIFNPFWYATERLSYEYVLKKIKEDPLVPQQLGYKLLERKPEGLKEVPLFTVDWQNFSRDDFKRYLFRQNPGDTNALGHVKFDLTNSDSIYLHGTPAQHLFSLPARAESSGCVRVEDPLKLTQFVMEGIPGWSAEKIEDTYNTRKDKPTYVSLPAAIPVYLLYNTTWVGPDKRVRYYEDVYKRDSRLATLLGHTVPASMVTATDTP